MGVDEPSHNKLGFSRQDSKSDVNVPFSARLSSSKLNVLRKCSSNFDESVQKRDATALSAKRSFVDDDKELYILCKKSKVAIESKQGEEVEVEEEMEEVEVEEEVEEVEVEEEEEEVEEIEVEEEEEEVEEVEEEEVEEVEEEEEEVEEEEVEVEEEVVEVEEEVEEEEEEVEEEDEEEMEMEMEMEEKVEEEVKMEKEIEVEGEEDEVEEVEEIKVEGGEGEFEGVEGGQEVIEEKEEEKHLESQVKEVGTKKEHIEVQQKELKSKENQFEGEVKVAESTHNEFDGELKEIELRENQYKALLKSFEEEINSVTCYTNNQSTATIDGRSLQLLPSDETEILDNLQGLSDPSKVVLDIIQNPIIQKYKMGDNAVIIEERDILLLEQLMRISPHIKPCVREEAMKPALKLKSFISETPENSVAVLGFLLLLSIYKLAPSFDEDEVLKLFGFAAQHKIAVKLFGILGFADKASDFVQKLITKKQNIEAA